MNKQIFTLFVALMSTVALMAQTITVDGINYKIAGDSAEVAASSEWGGYKGDIVIPSTITYESQTYRVTSLGYMSFFMDDLTSITIGEGVTTIGGAAFSSCSNLKSVTLPQSLKEVGSRAFDGCDSLPVVDGLRYADTYLVKAIDNKITSATIQEGTRFIGSDAFQGCKFSTIDLPESVIAIYDGAFFCCFSLTTIDIPASVVTIGETAFSQCMTLESITCRALVPPVCGYNAFSNVTKSIPVHVPNTSESAYKAADGWKDFTNIKGDISAIEQINADKQHRSTKIFRDGKIVILSNGQTYSITGVEL